MRKNLQVRISLVEEFFPINYFLKISLHAQINVCIQLLFEYFSTFHTQYKILERKKDNVDKTTTSIKEHSRRGSLKKSGSKGRVPGFMALNLTLFFASLLSILSFQIMAGAIIVTIINI